MRRYLLLSLCLIVMLLAASPVHADCLACAERASQFWATVHAQVSGTSPALADYLAHHEISHGHAAQNNYFLTPDCGLHPAQLEATLDIAKSLNIHMTIFLMGVMIDKWPDQSRALLQRAIVEGHELALHSYDHKSFVNLTHEQIYDEVVRNWALIDWALGYHYPMRFIRMPYGARNPTVMEEIGALGLQSVFWDIDSLGWRDYATIPIVHQQVASKTRPGSIIVFHCSSAADRGALPLYVQDLRAQGFEPRVMGSLYAPPTAADIAGYPHPRPMPAPPAVSTPAAASDAPATTAVADAPSNMPPPGETSATHRFNAELENDEW